VLGVIGEDRPVGADPGGPSVHRPGTGDLGDLGGGGGHPLPGIGGQRHRRTPLAERDDADRGETRSAQFDRLHARQSVV
jgi:hypothetical protein